MNYQISGVGRVPDGGQRGLAAAASAPADSHDVSALFREHHAELVPVVVFMARDRPSAEDVV